MFSEDLVISRQKEEPPGDKDGNDDNGECGKDAPGATLPEAEQRKSSLSEFLEDQTGDQESGDDKKHIHASIAAREPESRMEEHHSQNGNRT